MKVTMLIVAGDNVRIFPSNEPEQVIEFVRAFLYGQTVARELALMLGPDRCEHFLQMQMEHPAQFAALKNEYRNNHSMTV